MVTKEYYIKRYKEFFENEEDLIRLLNPNFEDLWGQQGNSIFISDILKKINVNYIDENEIFRIKTEYAEVGIAVIPSGQVAIRRVNFRNKTEEYCIVVSEEAILNRLESYNLTPSNCDIRFEYFTKKMRLLNPKRLSKQI